MKVVIAMSSIVLAVLFFALSAESRQPSSRATMVHAMQVNEIRPIAIDVRDKDAVARWATRMCDGFDLAEAAKVLNTSPTPSAIAKALTIHFPPASREVAIEACTAALNQGR